MFVGQVDSFGENVGGQLGYETNVETQEPNPTPTAVMIPAQGGPVVQAAVGADQSLVVTESGQLYAFGYNYYGQLGNEMYVHGSGPHGWITTPTPVAFPGVVGPVVQAAAGTWSSLAVTEGGQLYAFGDNFYGELGNEADLLTQEAHPVPAAVTLPGEVGPVTEASAGDYFSLALTESGQLYAFGANGSGQLGREHPDPPAERANPTPTLVMLPGGVGPITQIAAGGEFSLAVTESGQLYSWGENRFGQLGYAENSGPTERPSENAHPTPTLVSLPGDVGPVTQVAAGSNHSLVLTASGQLYAFGSDRSGQLGNTMYNGEAGSEANSTPRLVTLAGAKGRIMRISAGYETSYVLTLAGQLYTFGWNYFGELGRSTNAATTNPNPTPTLMALPGGASVGAIAVGQRATHMLATVGMLISTSALPSGTVGVSYEGQVEVSGGEAPYEWSASGLPAGLSIDPTTGKIAGTPTSAACTRELCRDNVTITVEDADEKQVSSSLPLELGSNVRSLEVATAGNGVGEVDSSPDGIAACGTAGGACQAFYEASTMVTLDAQPGAGSTFAGWSGGGCSGTAICQVALAADSTVSARFTKTALPAGGGERSPPPVGTPPSQATPLPAGLKIGSVSRAAGNRGLAVTVRGKIAPAALGAITVKVVGRTHGRRVTVSRRAAIAAGSWNTRLVLPGVGSKSSVHISVVYGGDAELLPAHTERTARLG